MTQVDVADAHTECPSLKNRRALITGGTTGIGRAIAVLLASEGAKVFVCGRTAEHLDDALERIREVGEGDGISVDLAEEEARQRFSRRRATISAASTSPSSMPPSRPRHWPTPWPRRPAIKSRSTSPLT